MEREIRRLKHPQTGDTIEAFVVPIENEKNEPLLIRLADGALIRIKVDIAEVSCAPDVLDNDGNPMYYVKSGSMMTILEPPK